MDDVYYGHSAHTVEESTKCARVCRKLESRSDGVWENRRRSKIFDGVHEMGGGSVNATNVTEAVLESNCDGFVTIFSCGVSNCPIGRWRRKDSLASFRLYKVLWRGLVIGRCFQCAIYILL